MRYYITTRQQESPNYPVNTLLPKLREDFYYVFRNMHEYKEVVSTRAGKEVVTGLRKVHDTSYVEDTIVNFLYQNNNREFTMDFVPHLASVILVSEEDVLVMVLSHYATRLVQMSTAYYSELVSRTKLVHMQKPEFLKALRDSQAVTI